MITWILGIILVIWVIIKRSGKEGKIKGEPLGMPRGTIRALNTLLIVTIPFNYLLLSQEIPGMITNASLTYRNYGNKKVRLDLLHFL